jgi:hypothetical protein
MAPFSVRTLGFPEIRRGDQPCRLALRKGLTLLIYLAEAKGLVGRDLEFQVAHRVFVSFAHWLGCGTWLYLGKPRTTIDAGQREQEKS